jgi:hypothetical protein
MDTQQIMRTALKLAGFKAIPADSEIHVKGRRIRKVLVSINVGVSELLLARNLECDAVIAHHPAGGTAMLEGYKVFRRHVEQLKEAGVPAEAAEEAVKPKYQQLELQHHSDVYGQTPMAAKRLGMPLVSIHSPCDEASRKIIVQWIKSLHDDVTVGELVKHLSRIPEYRKAKTKIEVRLGAAKNKAGRITVSHAAYTNGGYDIAKCYFAHGIGTVSYIHIAEADLTKLKTDGVGNLLILGHDSSDWLGVNALLKELEKNDVEALRLTNP